MTLDSAKGNSTIVLCHKYQQNVPFDCRKLAWKFVDDRFSDNCRDKVRKIYLTIAHFWQGGGIGRNTALLKNRFDSIRTLKYLGGCDWGIDILAELGQPQFNKMFFQPTYEVIRWCRDQQSYQSDCRSGFCFNRPVAGQSKQLNWKWAVDETYFNVTWNEINYSPQMPAILT